MRKIKASTAESALTQLAAMRHHIPYEWAGLRYYRQEGEEHYIFYRSKPTPNNYELYKVPKL